MLSEWRGDINDNAAMVSTTCVGDVERRVELLSVYNESIAMAVRRGAPVGSFAIGKRSLRNSVADSTVLDTCELICLVCARKFPRVTYLKGYEIVWTDVWDNKATNNAEGDRFLSLDLTDAERLSGVETYTGSYGRLGASAGAFRADSVELVYWHISAPFCKWPCFDFVLSRRHAMWQHNTRRRHVLRAMSTSGVSAAFARV